MYIKESNSLLLVVEGDDDHLALKAHCSTDLSLMAGLGGREQVLRAAALAKERNIGGVRFLVDRDYDSFTGSKATELDNVLVSTRHDIFMDLVTNDPTILRRVIEVHTAPARRRPNNPHWGVPEPHVIEEEARSLATLLAAVRIVNARRGLDLDFKRFSFFNLTVSQFEVDVIANMLLTRSGYDADSLAEVISQSSIVHAEIAQHSEPPVGDHDLFSALARVLRKFDVSISDQILQRSFILGISCLSLMAADWFDKVQKWCAMNSRAGFKCNVSPITVI